VVELPVEWIRDDAVYFNMNRFAGCGRTRRPPTSFDIFRASSTRLSRGRHLPAHDASAHQRLPLARVDPRGADPHMRAHEGVWFATHADVVRHAKAHAAA
jgi:hypothetical protein